MNPADFTQLGFGLSALAIIFLVIKYFIESQNKKDADTKEMASNFASVVKEMTNNFTNVITNHIVHETAQSKKETAVLSKLEKAIIKLSQSSEKSQSQTINVK